MCRPVTCKKCGKTTWAGCGQHVSQVFAGVPATQRCSGHTSESAASGGGASSGSASSSGRLRKLLGRG